MTLEEAAKVNIIPIVAGRNETSKVQPDPNNILLDSEYALMSKQVFDQLPDYTRLEPAEKYNGMIWKAQHCKYDGLVWFLCWCHNENIRANIIFISYREILILD